MPTQQSAALLLTLALYSGASAAEPPMVDFNHHDWEIACDNTRTCRAAGYSEESAEGRVSVLLTRLAGPHRAVSARVQFGHVDDDAQRPPRVVPMTVGGRSVGTVTVHPKSATGSLTASQTYQLLTAIIKNKEVTWGTGFETWTLSALGAKAVLLKMDEFQGRIGTPGALIRKGDKPETSALPPLPLPVIQAARLPGSQTSPVLPISDKAALIEELGRSINPGDCEDFHEIVTGEAELSIRRLSADRLLVAARCWLAPYNRGDIYWVVRDRPPFSPVVAVKDATAYANGTIIASQTGRGLGDCRNRQEWTWNGVAFIASAAMSTGMCRGIAPGGAWELPTLITKVSRPN